MSLSSQLSRSDQETSHSHADDKVLLLERLDNVGFVPIIARFLN